jgi:hypothetical protein
MKRHRQARFAHVTRSALIQIIPDEIAERQTIDHQ